MIEDIHDIRPPVMVGIDPVWVRTGLWVGAGLLLAGLIAIGVWYYMKQKKKKGALVDPLPVIPPYTAAVNALDRLSTGPVHDAKAFYFDLGRILKTYLGAAYGVNCLEMTTQELGRWIRTIGDIPGSLKSEITLFQDLCDPFRYAPLTPDQTQVNQDLARVRDLICAAEKARCVTPEDD